MLLYIIEIEGDYMTFVGVVDTPKEDKKISYRKKSIKELITNDNDNYLTLVDTDDETAFYNYEEVEDPSTTGIAFTNIDDFRTYLLTNLED